MARPGILDASRAKLELSSPAGISWSALSSQITVANRSGKGTVGKCIVTLPYHANAVRGRRDGTGRQWHDVQKPRSARKTHSLPETGRASGPLSTHRLDQDQGAKLPASGGLSFRIPSEERGASKEHLSKHIHALSAHTSCSVEEDEGPLFAVGLQSQPWAYNLAKCTW